MMMMMMRKGYGLNVNGISYGLNGTGNGLWAKGYTE
jgi:hypothetical protein